MHKGNAFREILVETGAKKLAPPETIRKKSKINCINGKKGVTSRTEYTGAIWI